MLSKENRLKGTANYKAIFENGEKYFSSFFVVYKLKHTNTKESQIGFIASKKVGGAVMRNRAKRLLAEAVRAVMKETDPLADYVFIAKDNIVKARLADIILEVKKYWV